MAVFTIGGRRLLASLLRDQEFFLAIGEGDQAWDTALVQPSSGDTALVAPVGVTRMRQIDFVTPDEAGTITMADGSRFSVTNDPTRYLYLQFKLDLADANGSTLRENGIYHATVIDPAVPPGQMFIPLADVDALGQLIEVDRFNSIIRDGTLEQSFSFVLTL